MKPLRMLFLLIGILSASVWTAPTSAQSAEIRWFYEGQIPEALCNWFIDSEELGKKAEHESTRTDLYLVTGEPSVNLKLREGRLELKLRLDAQDISLADAGIEGLGEIWTKSKWKYPKQKPDPVVEAFSASGFEGSRVAVWKNRWQRKYDLQTPRGEPMSVDLDHPRVPEGCAAELTGVEANGQPAWSLAVETLGTNCFETLKHCARWILRDAPQPFRSIDSRSYSQWLAERIEDDHGSEDGATSESEAAVAGDEVRTGCSRFRTSD